jgi:hypothetical protein
MKNRLDELIVQKAVLLKHLAWIEDQINEARAEIALKQAGLDPTPEKKIDSSPHREQLADASADSIARAAALASVQSLSADPASIRSEVRRGCLIYAAAAFAVGLTLLVIILLTQG